MSEKAAAFEYKPPKVSRDLANAVEAGTRPLAPPPR